MIAELAPYITIFTAVIAAYSTYRSQLRLKTFELLIERRKSVLIDIELFLGKLYEARASLDERGLNDQHNASKKYSREYFHEGLVLMHKINGANFGGSVDTLVGTFWSIITKPGYGEGPMSDQNFRDWIVRATNTVSLIYGLAHKELTKELENMALSWLSRQIKLYKRKKAAKVK